MMKPPAQSGASVPMRIVPAVVLVLLTASAWWGWFAWDSEYQRDPATGQMSGPYEPWQVIGSACCLIALAVIAAEFLRSTLVIVLMTVAFTAAYAITVVPPDETGLSGVGVLLVAIGVFVGVLVVVSVRNAVTDFIGGRGARGRSSS